MCIRDRVRLEPKKEEAKRKRWQAIAESAAKQSKRSLVPQVSGVMTLKAVSYTHLGGQHHDRGAESRPHACGNGVLYGGYVAGKAGHQGRAAEMVCVGKGKLLQLCKLRLADFGSQSLACLLYTSRCV